MPPRYAYWTILIDDRPTAFRAHLKEELMPTFHQLLRKNPTAVMRWFARGRLWESHEAEIETRKAQSARPPAPPRSPDWRPGGAHRDPRDRFKPKTRERERQERRRDAANQKDAKPFVKAGGARPAKPFGPPKGPGFRPRPPQGAGGWRPPQAGAGGGRPPRAGSGGWRPPHAGSGGARPPHAGAASARPPQRRSSSAPFNKPGGSRPPRPGGSRPPGSFGSKPGRPDFRGPRGPQSSQGPETRGAGRPPSGRPQGFKPKWGSGQGKPATRPKSGTWGNRPNQSSSKPAWQGASQGRPRGQGGFKPNGRPTRNFKKKPDDEDGK